MIKPHEELRELVAPLADALAADGAELQISSIDDGVLHVTVVAEDASCRDCLLPESEMAVMIMACIEGADTLIERVSVAIE